MNYFSYPKHKEWQNHYIEGRFRNDNGQYSSFLAFSKEWMEENLPKNTYGNNFVCNLLDTETGITYKTEIHCAYGEDEGTVFDKDYNTVNHWSLMSYVYEEHHCACHRHTDAVISGLNESDEDFECEGDRFLIQSIMLKDSDLILFSETITVENLEEKLTKICGS